MVSLFIGFADKKRALDHNLQRLPGVNHAEKSGLDLRKIEFDAANFAYLQ
jgi:hypothetical protein